MRGVREGLRKSLKSLLIAGMGVALLGSPATAKSDFPDFFSSNSFKLPEVVKERPNAPKVNLENLRKVVEAHSSLSYIKTVNERAKEETRTARVAVSTSPDVIISKEYDADTLRHQRKVVDLGHHDVCFLTASSHWGDDGAYCFLNSYSDGQGKLHWKLYSWCEDDPITHCRARCLDGAKLAYATRAGSYYFANNFRSDDEVGRLKRELEKELSNIKGQVFSIGNNKMFGIQETPNGFILSTPHWSKFVPFGCILRKCDSLKFVRVKSPDGIQFVVKQDWWFDNDNIFGSDGTASIFVNGKLFRKYSMGRYRIGNKFPASAILTYQNPEFHEVNFVSP